MKLYPKIDHPSLNITTKPKHLDKKIHLKQRICTFFGGASHTVKSSVAPVRRTVLITPGRAVNVTLSVTSQSVSNGNANGPPEGALNDWRLFEKHGPPEGARI